MLAVASIAGTDPSGGAGIQADIKTIAAHRLFAETAITALVAQNTLGVQNIEEVSPEFIKNQIDVIFEDIRPAAVKVGMVSSVPIVEAIAERLVYWKAENIVVDPVMVATSGGKLLHEDALDALREILIPLATVITPNIPEAEMLCGRQLSGETALEQAALDLARTTGVSVFLKGGHLKDSANDVLATPEGESFWFYEEHVNSENTHGTGCTLSSAIACNLAVGLSLEQAVRKAKSYVTGALRDNLNLGKGRGPLNHMWEFMRDY